MFCVGITSTYCIQISIKKLKPTFLYQTIFSFNHKKKKTCFPRFGIYLVIINKEKTKIISYIKAKQLNHLFNLFILLFYIQGKGQNLQKFSTHFSKNKCFMNDQT